jgi:hypothetical protein
VSVERPAAPDPAPDPELARALEALPPVEADPTFEARLRARFVRGDEPAVTLAPVPRRGSPLRLVATLVTLAAAVLVAFLLTTRGRADSGWTLVDGRSGDVVYLDDRATPADDAAAIASALAGGARVRTPEDVGLSLRLGEQLAVHVGPASEVALPRPERGLRDAPYLLSAEAGHLSVVTGPAFPGRRLVVRTPELEAEVVGTRFAVDVGEQGTCVCCTQGRVAVRSLSQPDEAGQVSGGSLGFGFPDGSLMTAEMLKDEHVEPLETLAGQLPAAWR